MFIVWLGRLDSNQRLQGQSLPSYLWTTSEYYWRAISESNRAVEVCNLAHSLSVNGSYLIEITVKPKFNYFTNIIINVFKFSSIKSFPIRFPFNLMPFFKVYSVSFLHRTHLFYFGGWSGNRTHTRFHAPSFQDWLITNYLYPSNL